MEEFFVISESEIMIAINKLSSAVCDIERNVNGFIKCIDGMMETSIKDEMISKEIKNLKKEIKLQMDSLKLLEAEYEKMIIETINDLENKDDYVQPTF